MPVIPHEISIRAPILVAASCLAVALTVSAARAGEPGRALEATTEARAGAGWRPVPIEALDVRLDEERPGLQQVGEALFRAGFALRSADPDFGGFSGLLIDGQRLVAVSDQGHWWRATLRLDDAGRLIGLDDGEMAPLADLDGSPVTGRERRDAEELVALGGELVVAFEGQHRTHVYRQAGDRSPRLGPAPEGVAAAPENGGMEAMARLGDGRLLVVSEDLLDEAGHLSAWIGDGETWQALSVATEPGFKATAASSLPGGDVLLLQRFYSPEIGVRVRLLRLSAEALTRAAEAGDEDTAVLVEGHEVARFQPPLSVDNFEALDVGVGDDGTIYAYLLADDNYRQEQRTLLFQLELPR